MKVYNKLVRDHIPRIIEESGKTYQVYQADDATYIKKLQEKLIEEAHEFCDEPSLEEMADLMEVIQALNTYYSFSKEAVEAVQVEKANKRGKFQKKLILEYVSSK